jgi:hypothetical protein
LLVVVAMSGCWGSSQISAGGDASTGDTSTGSGTSEDSETETDTLELPEWEPMTDCDGGKYDPATGLCWQDPPADPPTLDWYAAQSYCDTLELAGHDDWRLPLIQELISLVRDCPSALCGLSDPECLDFSCAEDTACDESCADLEGPGQGGCYWDSALSGDCEYPGWLWSASVIPETVMYDSAWIVHFEDGSVAGGMQAWFYSVRCVREEP